MTALQLRSLAALLLLAAPAALAQEPPAPVPKEEPAPKGGPAPKGEPAPNWEPASKEEVAKADAAVLEALVKKAMPLVEKLRGGKFKETPPVRPVTQEQFLERFMGDFARLLGGEDRVAPTSRLLARLGILETGTDMRALLGTYLQGNIAANYDPLTKKISFLPGVTRTLPLMIHELTHALDDQLFDMSIQIRNWDGSFDRALAYGALAEGDAESIEYRHSSGGMIAGVPLDKLREEADRTAAAVLRQASGDTPPAVVLAFKSQYIEGLLFAETLRRTEAKNGAIDAAFRDPPASTEQVLHPEKYLAKKDPPVPLALPAPPEGAKVLVTTTMGELGIRIVLIAKGMDAPAATAVAAGWGGDTAALVAFPGGEALLWSTAWDTEADATAFYEAMKVRFKALEGSDKPIRGVVQRGSVVEFVEAPLDALPLAVEMVKKVERK